VSFSMPQQIKVWAKMQQLSLLKFFS